MKGIDKSNLDTTIHPADDFYMYACGGWKKNNPLTAEYSRFGTFDLLRENARKQLRELIEGLHATPEASQKGTNAQKVSDLYAMGMDAERLNREGAAPIMPLVEKINAMKPEQFVELLVMNHSLEGGTFFGTGVGPDPKDSDRHIMYVGEAGLSLGDRDYYLEKNEENDRIMAAFEVYVKRIMELVGYDKEAQQRVWENVIAVEKAAAEHSMTREDRRNPMLRYNPFKYTELKEKFPNIPWDAYFEGLKIDKPENFNVSSMPFMEFANQWIPELPWQTILDYMTYDMVSGGSGLLSDDFHDANFDFFGRVMSGKEEPQPRWKRAMAIPNSMLGEAVGELYTAKYFPARNKEAMKQLVENLRAALADHIRNLTWMSEPTKEKALEKLASMNVKIGFPDKWKDYSGISIDPTKSYYENVAEASRWYIRDNYLKLNKPVDKTEWHMTPQTVNAYYSPISNEICFPAAILQPPYFDIDADAACNYGAIGVVIGHEMTHGFDDQGRQFDLHGNLENWWTAEDEKAFNALADRLVAQFDEVEVAPGVHANGRYTLGENIADQGGLRIALSAYKRAQAGEKQQPCDDGFTAAQRFYLAYANVWADNIRDEEVLLRVKTDPHSLGRHRVNVTLRNLQPFFDAFDIKEGDKMYRADDRRVIIW